MHIVGSAIPIMSASAPFHYPRAAPFHCTNRGTPYHTQRLQCLSADVYPTCCLLTGCVLFVAGDHEGKRWHICRGQVSHQHARAGYCGPLSGMPSLPCSLVCPVYVLVSLSCLSVHLPVHLTFCPSDVLSGCLAEHLPALLPACLFVCLSVCVLQTRVNRTCTHEHV